MKGDWRWQRNKGAAVRDENGRALKVYGSIEDVHEEKILREQLDSEQARLFDAIEQIKDGVMLWDSEQHLIFSNSVASKMLIEASELLPGMHISELVEAGFEKGFFALPKIGKEELISAISQGIIDNPGIDVPIAGGIYLNMSAQSLKDGRSIA